MLSIARAGDIQLLLDRVEVIDEAKASPDSRRIAEWRSAPHDLLGSQA
jgi:hypothetical protein